ncbi:hypothetical protein, partial [Streptomyces goshikiensis]|uniref:hypothetical protein n=1 Tax=Streptomyces goshikiensis TaxID=1942 RepID=UPI00365E93C7
MPEFDSKRPIMSRKGQALMWWSAERQRPSNGRRIQIQSRKRRGNDLVRLEPPERENAKANHLESERD